MSRPQHVIIERLLKGISTEVSSAGLVELQHIILTGSFGAWLKNPTGVHAPSWRVVPDANLYLLMGGDERDLVRGNLILKSAIRSVQFRIEEELELRLNIIIDLHPFSITPNYYVIQEGIQNIQLTTRSISISMRERYPASWWKNWIGNATVLYSKPGATMPPIPPYSKNLELLFFYRSSMSAYGNILQMLPLYTDSSEHFFDEVFRYFKEIARDGVALALDQSEFEAGNLYQILFEWKAKSEIFYLQRYGEVAASILHKFNQMEDDYFKERCNTVDPGSLLSSVLELKDIILSSGYARSIDEVFSNDSDINYSNIITAMKRFPLWC